jgi:DNA-binding MarR family transcriptional regulator
MTSDITTRPTRLPRCLRDEPLSVRLIYLYLLEAESATAAELAADLALSMPTVYQARDTLQAHSLLATVPDPDDGRRRRHRLRENPKDR